MTVLWPPIQDAKCARRVAGIFGCHNSGRSSLVNALAGPLRLEATPHIEPQTPVRVRWANDLTVVGWQRFGSSVVADSIQHGSRDEAIRQAVQSPAVFVDLSGPFEGLRDLGVDVAILETPGLDIIEQVESRADAYLPKCDVAILLVPYDRTIGRLERDFLLKWAETPVPVAILVARCDLFALADPLTLPDQSPERALTQRIESHRQLLARLCRDANVAWTYASNAFVGGLSVRNRLKSILSPPLDELREWMRQALAMSGRSADAEERAV